VARPWLVVLTSSLSGVSWVHGDNEVSVTDSVTVRPLWTAAQQSCGVRPGQRRAKRTLNTEERAGRLPVVTHDGEGWCRKQ
jgi:hypothetical protein